jgi:hypothetical protein
VLTATPPVAPLDPFTNSLATARNPSFLAPLGHQVDPAGPSGHVLGLASPVAPQTVSGGPELPVAARPAESRRSSLAAVVQRALAPRLVLSETAQTAPVDGPSFGTPAVAPASDLPEPVEALLVPRHLQATTLTASPALTSAPDPGERSTLPVVSSPSAHVVSPPCGPSATPTVSRSAVIQRSTSTDVPTAAPAVGSTPDGPSPAVAPLLGDTAPAAQVQADSVADTASSGDVPGIEPHQPFSTSPGPATGSATTGPLPAVRPATPPVHDVQRAATTSASPPARSPAAVAQVDDVPVSPPPSAPSGFPLVPSDAIPLASAPGAATAGSGPAQAEPPSVQRAPGLGAPLISAPAVPMPVTKQSATHRSTPDRPVIGGSNDTETPHIQRSTPSGGLGAPVPAHSPAGREPAPAGRESGPAAAAGAGDAHEAPMVGFLELMRVIDEGALAGGTVAAQPDAGRPVQRLRGDGEAVPEPTGRPIGLGAPLESTGAHSTGATAATGRSGHTVQRQASTTDHAGRLPVVAGPSVAPDAPTLGAAQPAVVQRQESPGPAHPPRVPGSAGATSANPLPTAPTAAPAPSISDSQLAHGVPFAHGDPADGPGDPVFLPPAPAVPGATELTLSPAGFDSDIPPAADAWAVQRAALSETAESVFAQHATSDVQHDRSDAGSALVPEHVDPPATAGSPPLASAPLLGAGSGMAGPSVPGPMSPAASNLQGPVQRAADTAALQRASFPPSLQQPIQRAIASPSAAASQATTGIGAPFSSSVPSGTDRVSSREMSFEQMFAPGAAAIASGAAYSDSPGSVVFRAPEPADLALRSNPTLGSNSTSGTAAAQGPSVQRFGLPSASSLVSGARNTAGSYADTARQSVGGLADSARNSAGGYVDTARHAVGGYADQAKGYAGSAVDAAGGYAERAGDTATGLVDSARDTAGGLADQAGRAVGGAADSAGGAARGLMTSAGDAASGAAAAGALPTDLNELARRLFDPLSERFKTELWLDRERAGMITDLRR